MPLVITPKLQISLLLLLLLLFHYITHIVIEIQATTVTNAVKSLCTLSISRSYGPQQIENPFVSLEP